MKCVLMSLNGLIDLLLKYCDADLALFPVRCGKDCIVGVWVKRAETSGVVAGIYCVDQSQIGKVVDVNAVFKHNNHS